MKLICLQLLDFLYYSIGTNRSYQLDSSKKLIKPLKRKSCRNTKSSQPMHNTQQIHVEKQQYVKLNNNTINIVLQFIKEEPRIK